MKPRAALLSFWLPRFAFIVSVIILGWALINIRLLIGQVRENMNHRPSDFEVFYHWVEGSVPPPYHYEIEIHIPPSGQAEISMTPDYPAEGVPVWTERFDVQPAKLDDLYRLMLAQGLFDESWRGQDMPPIGGSSESMTVSANGRKIQIPAFVSPGQEAKFQAIVSALRAMVPKATWDKLNDQRQQYMTENSNQ